MAILTSWHECGSCGEWDRFIGFRKEDAKCASCGSKFLRQLDGTQVAEKSIKILLPSEKSKLIKLVAR